MPGMTTRTRSSRSPLITVHENVLGERVAKKARALNDDDDEEHDLNDDDDEEHEECEEDDDEEHEEDDDEEVHKVRKAKRNQKKQKIKN